MKGLKALMETMSGKIDKLTEDKRALRSKTPTAAATTTSIDTTSDTSATETKWTGHKPRTNRRNLQSYLPHTNSHALYARRRGD